MRSTQAAKQPKKAKKQKAAGGFGGGIPGLNEDYERYQSGSDLNFDTDLHQAVRDRFGREIGQQFDERRADLLDRFDTGLMPTTLQNAREGQLEGEYGDALSGALIDAYMGIRGQNMGLTSDFASDEASNLGSRRGLQGAKAAASASRYGADRSAAVGMAGINAQREQNAWNNMFDLSNLQYADEMGLWDYGTNFEGNQLDDFIGRSLPIGNAGGQYYEPYVPQTNPYLQLGNTALGMGMMGYGGR